MTGIDKGFHDYISPYQYSVSSKQGDFRVILSKTTFYLIQS